MHPAWVMALGTRSSSVGIFVFIIYGFGTVVIHIADHQWINHISQHQNSHFLISLNLLTIRDFIWLNRFLTGLKRRTIIIKSHVQINPIFPLCIIGTQKYTILMILAIFKERVELNISLANATQIICTLKPDSFGH